MHFPEVHLAQLFGRDAPEKAPTKNSPDAQEDAARAVVAAGQPSEIDWETELARRGAETRLGEALRWTIDQERDGPLAGVIVVTDGCHNAGITPESVVSGAGRRIPLFPVGMGSEKPPAQHSPSSTSGAAPSRVFPGDGFRITGYVQAHGLAGRTVRLTLQQRTTDNQPTDQQFDRKLTLAADGDITPVQFEVTPDAVGRFQWELQVLAEDQTIWIPATIGSKPACRCWSGSRVLLLAGGPTLNTSFCAICCFAIQRRSWTCCCSRLHPERRRRPIQVLQDSC